MTYFVQSRRRRPGLARIGAIVLLIIVVILVALLIPAFSKVREAQAQADCMNNLKQIGSALQNFESTWDRLPPLYGGSNGDSVKNSTKFPNVWGSTHVFLLDYMEHDDFYSKMSSKDNPAQVDPTTLGGPGNTYSYRTFVCPSDPSMTDGIINGGRYGGTSYAANAQVFAPIMGELLTAAPDGVNGAMYPASHVNAFDRQGRSSKIRDGKENTIFFTHCYALCGSTNTGAIWGYGAGIGQAPSPIDTFQPWSRASYLKQTYTTTGPAFQNQPTPYLTQCVVTDPATPHEDAMLVLMGDGSVKTYSPAVSAQVWNAACMPNNELPLTSDW